MHKALLRQLKRCGLTSLVDSYPKLFESISDAYVQGEEELKLIEHSLFVVSNELNDRNAMLQQQVQELKRANNEVSQTGAELAAIFDATGEAIISFDCEGNLTRLNNRGKEFVNQLDGIDFNERALPSLCKNTSDLEDTFERIEQDSFIDVYGIVEFKRRRFYEYYSSPKVVNEKLEGRVWSFKDITVQKINDDVIRFQALHDSLTGLPNRNCMEIILKEQIKFHKFHLMSMAILFVDLVGLKRISDTQGYEVGDAVLIDSIHRIMLCLRDQDVIARFGGDGLIVVMKDILDKDWVNTICKKIEREVGQPVELSNHLYFVSCHIGISLYPEDGDTANELVHRADLAKYHGFNKGVSIQFFSSNIADEELQKITVESQLRKAIENLELALYLQPKVDIKSGEIKGAEGLIRWIKPDGSIISPGVFIPIAEKTGMIRDIGKLAVKEACKILAHWSTLGISDVPIAINLSIADFNDKKLVSSILSELRDSDVSPSKLILEVTESLFMADKDLVKDAMVQLGAEGVKFALDDFGTGYSSLSYLQELPFSYLKIDRSFLLEVHQDNKKSAIVQTIIDIGKNLGLMLVAEGVEDVETLEFVREKTGNEALVQGFLFYKPMPHDNLTGLLLDSSKGNKSIGV
ncbi:EAL domain-containing protein [Hahella sp. CR1]|uniref:putative bifunctional diguanylate cyclase/phosphodiesterase n=1 Tax=Hahella sp. CR1 TaxID=2992807 RepID=UPI00244211BC|nr:bifunctional diguanylate cyclase/phosphodiesterase [Hahella sp. CR1]MDG9669620.1 EAL domain-containing protein [Hahella sp. CR1]